MKQAGISMNAVKEENGTIIPLIFEPLRNSDNFATDQIVRMFKYLLEIGCDPNSSIKGSDDKECTILFYIVIHSKIDADLIITLIDLLVDHEANVLSVYNYWKEDGNLYSGSALQAAKKKGDQTLIKHLERLVNMQDKSGVPLYVIKCYSYITEHI